MLASLDWFPEPFSALDRLRIDQALGQAAPTHVRGGGSRGLVFLDLVYPAEADAVHAVVSVFAVVVQILDEHRQRGSLVAIDRRAAAHRLLADLIARVHPYRWHPSGLDDFVAAVRHAVDDAPWWRAFVTATRATTPPTKKDTRDRETVRAHREGVVLPLLDQVDWTPTQWALNAGVDPSVTLDYLSGKSTPQKVHRHRITFTLMKALQVSALKLPK